MANINEILARAAALRDETALNSISPERAGSIMYDTLLAMNELWLQQGAALVISKIYASVSAMEADTAPVSDLTGLPLRSGQIVVIASSDSDNGSVYRYNGPDSPSWSLVGEIGNLQPVDSLDSDSTSLPLAAHQGKVLDGKISQLGQEIHTTNIVSSAAGVTPYIFKSGVTYRIINNLASGVAISHRNTPDGTSEDVVTIPASQQIDYTPTTDGKYLRYGAACNLNIYIKGSVFGLSKNVPELSTRVDTIVEGLYVLPELLIQEGKAVNYATGVISDVADNNTIVIDLTQIKAKLSIKFIETVSSYYGYGFLVNGVWTGSVFSGGGSTYGQVIAGIPEGATEFRFSWNANLYPYDNPVYCVLEDGLLQAFEAKKQIPLINENIDTLNSAVFREINIDVTSIVISGGILLDGTFDTNGTFGRVEIQLGGDVIYKSFTFKKTYVNNGSRCCYGFVVNNQWIGYPGLSSTQIPMEEVTVEVPRGATSFLVSWNRNMISDENFVLTSQCSGDSSSDVPNKPIFQFCPDYILSRVPTYTIPSESQILNLKPADIYALYDALVQSYPEYITKVDCDSIAQAALSITAPSYMDGLPIYMYKFSPKIGGNGTGVDSTSRVKLFVTSMHPQEKLGIYVTYCVMKMLCENWTNDVNAEQLRSLVDIYVMPCPWTWNMENGRRTNYNGVNGNRQFPTRNWTESGIGTQDYTGPYPLSEYEAKVINYFFLEIKPNVCLDVHTSGNDNVGHMGIILVNKYDQSLIDLCGIIARTTSNRAIQDNPNFPSSPDTCIYGVYPEDGSVNGEFYEYAYEQGCKFAILSEESPYSNWDNGVFGGTSGPTIEKYTDGILKEQIQWIFNILLRLTRQACVMFYE